MKGVCPDCGCAGDLIVFVPDGEARQAIAAALKIMPDMQHLVLRYLGMFRPANRAMTMSRTVALLQQIANDMDSGQIERNGRKWVAPRNHWKAAMEQMIESRDKIRMPLKSHAYLYEILSGLANGEEAKAETRLEGDRKTGQHRRQPDQTQTIQRTDPVKAAELVNGLKTVLNSSKTDG